MCSGAGQGPTVRAVASVTEECCTSGEGGVLREGGVGDADGHPKTSGVIPLTTALARRGQVSDVCPEPRASAQPEERPIVQLTAVPEERRTSVEGDECYEKVEWAMRVGIHSAWSGISLSRVTPASSFEDFQHHLHGMGWFPTLAPSQVQRRSPRSGSGQVLGARCLQEQ
eukprot:9475174-Pyramimonas_sp.AAC.1